jgi:hypothetical protein
MAPSEQRRLGDVQSRWLLPAVVGAAAFVFAAVLYLTSYKNFYYDEWDFVTKARPWDPSLLLLPHNEHWSTIPLLVWKVLFIVVGIRSHLPYEAASLVVHATAALLMFALIRRRSGDLIAFAAALTLLVLGSGATDITWAFQITWVASIAFGLLAMLLLDGNPQFPSRIFAASAALICSLMCSGVGLAFLAAVGAELLVDRSRRKFLFALVAPGAIFAAWFLAFGAGLPGTPGAPCPTCAPSGFRADVHKGPIGLSYLASLGEFVKAGLDASVAGLFGLSVIWAPLLVIVVAFVVVHWISERKVSSWQIGMITGVLVWFTLVGLGRAQLGPGAATDSHYVYVGIVFLLPVIANAARVFPWRGLWKPSLVAVFAICLVGNITLLRDQAIAQTDLMRTENAQLQTVTAFRGAPDMDLMRSLDDTIMPQLSAGPYFAATDALGLPVPSATIDTLRQLPSTVVDLEMLNLFGGALKVEADNSRSTLGLECRGVDPSQGTTMDFRVPDGQWVVVEPSKSGEAFIYLGFLGPPSSKPIRKVQLQALTPEWIYVPDTGKPAVWQLRIQTIDANVVRVCSTATLHVSQTLNNLFRAQAESFTLGKGWTSVVDVSASAGGAARVSSGTAPQSGAFGMEFVPAPGSYDVWYRVKVNSNTATKREIILTVTDTTAGSYLASNTLAAYQASTSYAWLPVASNVVPTSGHLMRFQVNIANRLSTDWFVDEAIMVPAGSPPPAPGAY